MCGELSESKKFLLTFWDLQKTRILKTLTNTYHFVHFQKGGGHYHCELALHAINDQHVP